MIRSHHENGKNLRVEAIKLLNSHHLIYQFTLILYCVWVRCDLDIFKLSARVQSFYREAYVWMFLNILWTLFPFHFFLGGHDSSDDDYIETQDDEVAEQVSEQSNHQEVLGPMNFGSNESRPDLNDQCAQIRDLIKKSQDNSALARNTVSITSTEACHQIDEKSEESSEVLRSMNEDEQMECEDFISGNENGSVQIENSNSSAMFVDEEDSSSSRVLIDTDCPITDSQMIPQPLHASKKNKRKNFKPMNILYNQRDGDSETVDSGQNYDDDNDDDDDDNSFGVNSSCATGNSVSNESVSVDSVMLSIRSGSRENGDSILDLSGAPIRQSLLPRRFSPIPQVMDYFQVRPESPGTLIRPHVSTFNGREGILNPLLPDYAQMTMRRLLQMYGLPPPDFNKSGRFK